MSAKVRNKYDPVHRYPSQRESTVKENNVICDHLRTTGKASSNPLLHIMYDKGAMATSPDATNRDGGIDLSRTRGGMQVALLEKLESEDYDQVQQRISDLQTKLNDVNNIIKKTESEVAATVVSVRSATIRNTAHYYHQREIAPALSTFNWSSGGTTQKESFTWKNEPGKGGSKFTNQWGEMSKYADDPCAIMLAMKNKEIFEATRKKKTGGALL